MDTKKKHNINNITSWIATFILLAFATANIFNYIGLKKPYNSSNCHIYCRNTYYSCLHGNNVA